MTLTEKQINFHFQMAQLLTIARSWGFKVKITYLFRSHEEQFRLYKEGKSKCDGVVKRSAHQDGLAVDIVIINNDGTAQWERDDRYERLGDLWKKNMNGTWGGDWESLNDIYHFESGEWTS